MKSVAAVLLLFPLSCFAVDGVYEINQLCVDSGCFSGDSPGWPVDLGRPGSYRLTSNLDFSEAEDADNITAITITTEDVNLDLNGFTIRGQTQFPHSGVGVGIHSFSQNTTISNGHVLSMGDRGIICGDNCRIDGVTVTYNGSVGIQMMGFSLLTNSVSSFNHAGGVVTPGVVKNCVIAGNGGSGLFASSRSIIEGTQIVVNAGNGVECSGCSLINNVISENTNMGVVFSGLATFGGNQITSHSGGDTNIPVFQTAPNNCSGVACP